MNNKQNIDEICRIVKDECDRIIVANDQEEVYQCIDGILELLPLLLKATYVTDEKTVDKENGSGTIEEQQNDGGPGSGNHGHAGVPGQVGGSAPTNGANCKGTTEYLKQSREEVLSKKRIGHKAIELRRAGFANTDQLHDAIEDGTIDDLVNQHFDILEKDARPKSLTNETHEAVAKMSLEEKREWVGKALERPDGYNTEDNPMQKLVDEMQLNETPQVVSAEDFDAYVSENGMPVIYRTVHGNRETGQTDLEIAYETMHDNSKNHMGVGFKGSGIYFSTGKSDSATYGTAQMRGTLRKDSRVFDYEKQKNEIEDLGIGGMDATTTWALCNGYDALMQRDSATGDTHILVFNKAALVMDMNIKDLKK